MATIWWIRKDLRLHDNPALHFAVEKGEPIIPLYIFSPADEAEWEIGGASRWWLHESLQRLGESLKEKYSSRLILRRGPSLTAIEKILRETGAKNVVWNRRYEPHAIESDSEIKSKLIARGLDCHSFNALLLREPWEVKKGDGSPYKVYTPYMKASWAYADPAAPLPTPERLPAPEVWPHSLQLDEFALKPKIEWDKGFRDIWEPGEAGALARLKKFSGASAKAYHETRNLPGAKTSTSRLSPHLHFGELSPRLVWKVLKGNKAAADLSEGSKTFINEVIWRDFAYQLFYFFPKLDREPLQKNFESFPWVKDAALLKAWTRGQTGYPIVDAGMRELWHTGWMHNRVRMIVASFLVKDLLISWREGAAWFWDTLVDADLAQNSFNWQWVAGCGADAAPFFRIFNPVLQGEKFDPDGDYVRRWVPELGGLPNRLIHKPWEAGSNFLHVAGVELGVNYPRPIVDHDRARLRALAVLKGLPK